METRLLYPHNFLKSPICFLILFSFLIFAAPAANAGVAVEATEVQMVPNKTRLKLYSNMSSLGGNYIDLKQGQLEELDFKGRVVRKMSMKHGDWSDVEVSDDGIYSINYTATDHKKAAGQSWPELFNMTVQMGTERSVNVEPAMCQACTVGTSGMCQNSRGRCASMGANNFCRRGFSACETAVVVEKDILKLSLTLENWIFQDQGNKLRFKLKLKTKRDKKVYPVTRDQWSDINLFETGLLSLPQEAVITDNMQTEISVYPEVVVKNNKTITIDFPSFPEGWALLYNP